MARVVEIMGPDGITKTQLRTVFHLLGQERFDRGVAMMLEGGRVVQSNEKAPNRAGRMQMQAVYRLTE